MRKFIPSAIGCGLLAIACSGRTDRHIPTTPTQSIATPTPVPAPPFAFAEPYTQITAGEVISRRVTADAPPCVGFPEFRCQHFRLSAPANGHIDVTVTTIRSVWYLGLDVSLTDSSGREYWGPVGGENTLAVRAGTTYQMTVWYATPGDEFELRSSLRPD